MPKNTLRPGAYQFNTSTNTSNDLKDFEQSLRSIQAALELGMDSANINSALVSIHIQDLSQMKTYLKDMQKAEKAVIDPKGGIRLQLIADSRTSLDDAIAALLRALSNCKRIEYLENKYGEEVANERNAEYKHLYNNIRACEEPLSRAEEKIRELGRLKFDR